MIAVEPVLNGETVARSTARWVPPQFKADAWRLSAFIIVAAFAYAAYNWSPDIGWVVLWTVRSFVPALGRIPDSSATMLVDSFRAFATVGVALALCRLLPATSSSFGFVAPRLAHIWLATKVWLGALTLATAIQVEVNHANGEHADPVVTSMAQHRGAVDYWSDVLNSAVATPLVEETLFRGLLFAALIQWVPAWLAVLLSSLVFALWHQEPYRILPLTVLGIGLAYIYYRSGTLWAPIAAHALNNWLAVSLTFLVNSFGR
jgi:membrane protease YdiL (CAAX protease family)